MKVFNLSLTRQRVFFIFYFLSTRLFRPNLFLKSIHPKPFALMWFCNVIWNDLVSRLFAESTEVLSPKQKSPSLEGVSQMAGFSGLNMVREPGKSPYGDPSSMVRSPPVSPRTMHRAHTVRMLGVAGDKRMISPKGSSSKMMRMNSGPESKGIMLLTFCCGSVISRVRVRFMSTLNMLHEVSTRPSPLLVARKTDS